MVSERASHKYMSLPFSFYHSSHQSPFNMDKRAQQQTKKKEENLPFVIYEMKSKKKKKQKKKKKKKKKKNGKKEKKTCTQRLYAQPRSAHTHTPKGSNLSNITTFDIVI